MFRESTKGPARVDAAQGRQHREKHEETSKQEEWGAGEGARERRLRNVRKEPISGPSLSNPGSTVSDDPRESPGVQA